MRFSDDRRVPWWGLLIEGQAEEVAPLVAIAIEEADGDLLLVPGKGWTGVLSLHHDEPHRELADAVRATGREVMILEWGELQQFVWRWNGATWELAVESPTRVAEAHGVYGPGSSRPSDKRAVRFAALIEGARIEDVVAAAKHAEHVIATPRGPVVVDFAEEALSAAFAETPGMTVYRVVTFLDTGEFVCDIWNVERVAVYRVPPRAESVPGIELASDVDGETDPRAIVRRLCLPEDYLFPKERT